MDTPDEHLVSIDLSTVGKFVVVGACGLLLGLGLGYMIATLIVDYDDGQGGVGPVHENPLDPSGGGVDLSHAKHAASPLDVLTREASRFLEGVQ